MSNEQQLFADVAVLKSDMHQVKESIISIDNKIDGLVESVHSVKTQTAVQEERWSKLMYVVGAVVMAVCAVVVNSIFEIL